MARNRRRLPALSALLGMVNSKGSLLRSRKEQIVLARRNGFLGTSLAMTQMASDVHRSGRCSDPVLGRARDWARADATTAVAIVLTYLTSCIASRRDDEPQSNQPSRTASEQDSTPFPQRGPEHVAMSQQAATAHGSALPGSAPSNPSGTCAQTKTHRRSLP